MKDLNSKLLRWRIKFDEFDKIIYKKGKLNTNADALSRINIHTKWKMPYWEQFGNILHNFGCESPNVRFNDPHETYSTDSAPENNDNFAETKTSTMKILNTNIKNSDETDSL